jgi:hypothetical protein
MADVFDWCQHENNFYRFNEAIFLMLFRVPQTRASEQDTFMRAIKPICTYCKILPDVNIAAQTYFLVNSNCAVTIAAII